MSISILYPGGQSILVDSGRFGHAQKGITASGPADPVACHWANRLVGNPRVMTSIETLLGELEMRVNQRCTLAVSGAQVDVWLDDKPVCMWQGIQVHAGQRIRLGRAQQGLRTYIAVCGGFEVKQVLGSSTAVKREQLGGMHGRGDPLAKDDLVPLAKHPEGPSWSLPRRFWPAYDSHIELALVPCYQWQDFARNMQTRLLSQRFTVKADSDKMGLRLSGEPVKCTKSLSYSEGLALGAVQCPPDGQPIVMLADRQTIGGYPKPGVVSTLDCGRLGQIKPGDTVSFYLSDALTERRRWLLNEVKLSKIKLNEGDSLAVNVAH